jgi:hypothetical protein
MIYEEWRYGCIDQFLLIYLQFVRLSPGIFLCQTRTHANWAAGKAGERVRWRLPLWQHIPQDNLSAVRNLCCCGASNMLLPFRLSSSADIICGSIKIEFSGVFQHEPDF